MDTTPKLKINNLIIATPVSATKPNARVGHKLELNNCIESGNSIEILILEVILIN